MPVRNRRARTAEYPPPGFWPLAAAHTFAAASAAQAPAVAAAVAPAPTSAASVAQAPNSAASAAQAPLAASAAQAPLAASAAQVPTSAASAEQHSPSLADMWYDDAPSSASAAQEPAINKRKAVEAADLPSWPRDWPHDDADLSYSAHGAATDDDTEPSIAPTVDPDDPDWSPSPEPETPTVISDSEPTDYHNSPSMVLSPVAVDDELTAQATADPAKPSEQARPSEPASEPAGPAVPAMPASDGLDAHREAVDALQKLVMARISTSIVRGQYNVLLKTHSSLIIGMSQSSRKPLRVLMRTCDALDFLQRMSNHLSTGIHPSSCSLPSVPSTFFEYDAWHLQTRYDDIWRYTHQRDIVVVCAVEINSDWAEQSKAVWMQAPAGADRVEAWQTQLTWLMHTITAAKQASLSSDEATHHLVVPEHYTGDRTAFTGLPCVLWLGGYTNDELKAERRAASAPSASAPSAWSASAPPWRPAPASTWYPPCYTHSEPAWRQVPFQ